MSCDTQLTSVELSVGRAQGFVWEFFGGGGNLSREKSGEISGVWLTHRHTERETHRQVLTVCALCSISSATDAKNHDQSVLRDSFMHQMVEYRPCPVVLIEKDVRN